MDVYQTSAVLKNDKGWNNFGYTTFLQLRPGVNKDSIEKRLNTLLRSKRDNDNIDVSLQPLNGMYFETDLQSSDMPHGNKKTTYIFSLLGILLLVTACINYVNLTTAKASLRAKEVSVKKIVRCKKSAFIFSVRCRITHHKFVRFGNCFRAYPVMFTVVQYHHRKKFSFAGNLAVHVESTGWYFDLFYYLKWFISRIAAFVIQAIVCIQGKKYLKAQRRCGAKGFGGVPVYTVNDTNNRYTYYLQPIEIYANNKPGL
jgi:hypothetical protein